jgi:hypothetical protein
MVFRQMRSQLLSNKRGNQPMTTIFKEAYESIIDSYDRDTLNDIARYGCISGSATKHITYHQTNYFYDKHEDEILDYLNLINYTTESPIQTFGGDAQDITQLKNNLTWAFIDNVAQEYILENEVDE